MSTRMPVVFLPHGGGPWPFVEMGLDRTEMQALVSYLQSVKDVPPERPRALLVISAHWEEAVPTVMTSPHPPMLYDYYGFPEASYRITWPAPGAPDVAARVREVLGVEGITTKEDPVRGFDHGTFVPLKVAYPDADVPVVQLSLYRNLDPMAHLALGAALEPLRDEGIFIIGSGMTFHNLRIFFRREQAEPVANAFDNWLRRVMELPAMERSSHLTLWDETAPMSRTAHPREEHLIPLMVTTGAAGDDLARLAFNGTFGGLKLSAFHFGETR